MSPHRSWCSVPTRCWGVTIQARSDGDDLHLHPAGLPAELYARIAADVSQAGVPVLVDLSTSRLDQTLAHGPALVKLNDRSWPSTCADSLTGAIAAAWARGLPLREALVLGAAAGAGNYPRHGIGTGRREVVEQLVAHVVARRWTGDASPTVQTAS